MARIKIEQVNEYYNVELIDVFPDEVAILGGENTENAIGDNGLMNTQTEIDKAYKEGYEKGAEEMRLEAKKPIEKFIKQRERQAVKEFSEKLIRLVFDYLDVENAEQAEQLSLIDSTLTYDVILHAIDKLIKEEN